MQGRRWSGRAFLIFAGVAVVAASVWVTRRVPTPIANPPGSFAFAALGDAPYYWWEQRRFRLHPLTRRTTGRWLVNFTRLEVPGSPDVGWVRVVVTPGAAQPFAFQPLIVSGWRFW